MQRRAASAEDRRACRQLPSLPRRRRGGLLQRAHAVGKADDRPGGGIARAALDAGLQLRALPGVFAAGEMLDWEAPTGGYLLTACLATGRHAGQAAARLAGALPRPSGA